LGADLRAATLGIVGMGKIGYAVAERARAFGLRLLYTSRSRHPEAEAELGAVWRELDDLLGESDFVSLHCPLTENTRHLIDAAALARMKPSALLINTSRGPVVDADALVHALEHGGIAGAALDVTDPEPLPAEHALYRAPGCLVVPHIGSATHGTRRRMARLACENVLAALAGEPLPHAVEPARGFGVRGP
jgi:phosphoglycerate dehydrogenase-like enzyme